MALLHSDCLGVVLSGGLSSRMGTDKALLARNHQDMLTFSQQLLVNSGVEQVVISGKQHGVADKIEHLGPMGGIYTIIEKYRPKALLVLPVDLPLMTAEALTQLKRVGELSQQVCYYQEHYLPFYLPITAFVEQFFQEKFALCSMNNVGERKNTKNGPSIRSLISQVPSKSLTPKNSICLFNANTPDEWQQAKRSFSSIRNTHV